MQSNIKQADRSKITGTRGETPASTDRIEQKTPGIDRNETGLKFVGTPKLTEGQYEDLAASIDAITEWIKVLGAKTPAGLSVHSKKNVVDDKAEWCDVDALVKQMRTFVEIAKEADDVFATSLLTARIAALEKASWMLSANMSSSN